MSARRPKRVFGLAVLLVSGACSTMHTQQIAMQQAGRDFENRLGTLQPAPASRATFSARAARRQSSPPPSAAGALRCPAKEAKARLRPWIVAPNRYLIEGCGHQAVYACVGDSCSMVEGSFQPIADSAAAAVPPPSPPASIAALPPPPPTAAPTSPPEPPPAEESPEEVELRAALDARRSEIAACGAQLPLAVQVTFAPGAPAQISVRGAGTNSPEQRCVRHVLKAVAGRPFSGSGTLIHVVN